MEIPKPLLQSTLIASLCTICAAQTVNITSYALPATPGVSNSEANRITTGPDGALWFTEYMSNKIGRITTAGVISEYAGATAEQPGPQGIAAGPDGALWFAESGGGEFGGNVIGRITTAGVITEYAIPTSNSSPTAITAGPDGALWFTENLSNKIGRITTAGVISEYTVPMTDGYPYAITVGPDGALWYTKYGNGNSGLGRMTTLGAVTEYAIPTPNSFPSAITAGPDGALWFTEANSDKIGRITTAGVISEYPVPTPNSLPSGITAGPDGALWFTEADSDKIGRITTTGVFAEYDVPLPSSTPIGITLGPDGALWFTETNGIGIGRAAVSSASLSLSAVTSAASNLVGPIAPGEIVALYGSGLGPAQLTSAHIGSDGLWDAQLAGTSVQFNGISAPILYTSAAQVAAIVPYEVTGPNAQVAVTYQAQSSAAITVAVGSSAPGLFTLNSTGTGQAAAVNQNGSINGPSMPAPVGSIISLYATGEGLTYPAGVDGKPAAAPLPTPDLPVNVTIGGATVNELQYVGGAPGEVAGLLQINVAIPTGITPGSAVPVVIRVGDATSQAGVTIAVSAN
jgi:uncharacterized protein (TIGR03437 family)